MHGYLVQYFPHKCLFVYIRFSQVIPILTQQTSINPEYLSTGFSEMGGPTSDTDKTSGEGLPCARQYVDHSSVRCTKLPRELTEDKTDIT